MSKQLSTYIFAAIFLISLSSLSASNFGIGASIGYATFNMDKMRDILHNSTYDPIELTDEFPGNLYYKIELKKKFEGDLVLGISLSYTSTRFCGRYTESNFKIDTKHDLIYINVGAFSDFNIIEIDRINISIGAETGRAFITQHTETSMIGNETKARGTSRPTSWFFMPRIGAYKLFNRFKIGVQVGWLIEFGQINTSLFEFDGLRAGINFNYYFGDFNF
jgi:hypothetical protein